MVFAQKFKSPLLQIALNRKTSDLDKVFPTQKTSTSLVGVNSTVSIIPPPSGSKHKCWEWFVLQQLTALLPLSQRTKSIKIPKTRLRWHLQKNSGVQWLPSGSGYWRHHKCQQTLQKFPRKPKVFSSDSGCQTGWEQNPDTADMENLAYFVFKVCNE